MRNRVQSRHYVSLANHYVHHELVNLLHRFRIVPKTEESNVNMFTLNFFLEWQACDWLTIHGMDG